MSKAAVRAQTAGVLGEGVDVGEQLDRADSRALVGAGQGLLDRGFHDGRVERETRRFEAR
jgi:hypothetical protein